MFQFSRDLAALIKSFDSSRLVASGFSLPRRSATHLMRRPEFSPGGPDWTTDTSDEFKQYLLAINEPFDIISVHVYPDDEGNRFGRPAGHQYKMVTDAAEAAKAARKRLFVGEFGDSGVTPFMVHLLDELVQNRVDYAALWVWEYYQTSTDRTRDTDATKYSVEPGYSDDLIDLLTKTKRRLGGGLPTKPGGPRVVLTWPLPCVVVDRPIVLTAVASDGARGVKSVEFVTNGRPLATVTMPPYRARLDPAGLGNGTMEIEVRAVAASGATAEFKSTVKLNAAKGAACTAPTLQ